MNTFKFVARVSEQGTIQIPEGPTLTGEEVEVVIRPKTQTSNSAVTATEFIEKRSGFLTEENTDQSKYDYLVNKYQ